MKKPNILFILTDQQMANSLGCYGNEICKTPHIDALAAEGLRFQNAYAVCPICTPARASIQTGVYPFKHGMITNIYNRGCMVHELADNPDLLSRRLQAAGYHTGFTGKWHLGFWDERAAHPEYQFHIAQAPYLDRIGHKGSVPSTLGYDGDDFPGHGGVGITTPQYQAYLESKNLKLKKRIVHPQYPDTFEVLSGTESTVSHFLMEQAMDCIGEYLNDDNPFYYQLNFWGPHGPYHASTEYVDLYRETPIPEWPSYRDPLTDKPNIHDAHRTETTADWNWDDYQTVLRTYYASITEIDDKIGQLIQFLKDRGAYDNTLIVFSSDHGDSIGIHQGLTDKSIFLYEETTRIPLILKPAAADIVARRGECENRFAQTCDLYSTFLEAAGYSREGCELDGRSLLPLLRRETTEWRDCVVTEASGLDFLLFTQRALRHGDLKYVFNCADPDELYDLTDDPDEMHNRVHDPEYALPLLTMRRKLERWMIEMNDGLLERYRRIRHLN